MSTALSWKCHNLLGGIVSYRLTDYPITISELFHMTKFPMLFMLLASPKIHTLQFPTIGNTTLIDIQTSNIRATPAVLLKCG
jgi:hypothetical protein